MKILKIRRGTEPEINFLSYFIPAYENCTHSSLKEGVYIATRYHSKLIMTSVRKRKKRNEKYFEPSKNNFVIEVKQFSYFPR